MWADPDPAGPDDPRTHETGYRKSDRGRSYVFNEKTVTTFIKR